MPGPATAHGFLEVYFDTVTGRNTMNIFRHERKSQSFAVRRASGANFDESELRGSANRAGTLGCLQLHLVSYRRLMSWAERGVRGKGMARGYKMVPVIARGPGRRCWLSFVLRVRRLRRKWFIVDSLTNLQFNDDSTTKVTRLRECRGHYGGSNV